MIPRTILRTSTLSLILLVAACGGRKGDGGGGGGDTDPPVITLLGENPVLVEKGTEYVDAGATALDPQDGDLSDQIEVTGLDDVNVDVLGTYEITYEVSDSSNNEADPVTRDVVVYDPNVTFTYSDPFFLGTAALDSFASSPQVGGAVATYSIVPDLPEGIDLDPATGVISGAPTAKSDRTTYTITGVNDSGAGTAQIVLEVVSPARFAYAANSDERTISILRCDADTGRIFPHSYHFMQSEASGDNKGLPQHLSSHPSGEWLLATTSTDALVVYAVDPTDGSLSYTSGEYLGPGAPHPLVLSSDGALLHVGGSGASPLRTYSFDAKTGDLTQVGVSIATSPVHELKLSHDGTRLVTLDRDSELVRSWSVDSEGIPTQQDEYFISIGDAGQLALSRDGSNAYIALTHPMFDLLARLPIDADGLITDEEARPGPEGTDLVTLHPLEDSIYVSSTTTHEVRRYPLDSGTGEVGVQSESETTELGGLSDLRIGQAGRWMHAADLDAGELDLIAVDAETGAVSEGGSARVRLGAKEAPAIVRREALLEVNPLTLYVSCGSSAMIDAFEVDPTTGLLTFLQTTPTQAEPRELVVGNSDDRLYIANYADNSLSTFEVQADGRLGVELDTLSMSPQPIALALEPSGRFLYANSVNAKRVFGFEIKDTDGTLRSIDGGGGGVAVFSRALDADPTGRFLYCASSGETPFNPPWPDGDPGTITVLHIDVETGHPTPIDESVPGTVTVPFAPTFVAFDPSGVHAYTNQTAPGVHVAVPIAVAHADGAGTVVTPGTSTGDTPTAIEISITGRFGWVATSDGAGGGALRLHDVYPDGSLRNANNDNYTARETYLDVSDPIALSSDSSERWLYVLNSGSQTVSVWEIDATDGTLTKLGELTTSTDPQALHLNESL